MYLFLIGIILDLNWVILYWLLKIFLKVIYEENFLFYYFGFVFLNFKIEDKLLKLFCKNLFYVYNIKILKYFSGKKC